MTDWIGDLGDRAGSLAAPARAFAARRGGTLPRSVEAIRAIADAVDDLAHDPDASDEDDHALVQEAGALLGLVLVERFGGRHAKRDDEHRVLLGPYGCFDPFAAIDAALDALDPADKLRERIRLAEGEGRGTGPIARVLRAFEAALIERGLPHTIVDRFDLEVSLDGGIEIDLRRVAEATEDMDEEAVRAAAARVVALLPGAEGDAHTPWSEARGRLLPRLVGSALLERLGDGADLLYLRSIGHDVHVALQLRYDGRSRYARQNEVIRWRDEGGLPHARALERLAHLSSEARFARVDGDDGTWIAGRSGDGLDAARLLLPTLHGVLARELADPIYVSAPHRDTLLASSDRDLLQRRTRDATERAPHPISDALFYLGPGSLQPA